MRDVDLFVSVASIGLNPDWEDRPEGQHADYRLEFAFGPLRSEVVKARRDALEGLIPRLKIVDKCAITDRFLSVRGERDTYNIHIGSGGVIRQSDGRHLCIVIKPGTDGEKSAVRLPFEGDAMLSLVLSKAFLLAEESRIRDRSILTQLARH